MAEWLNAHDGLLALLAVLLSLAAVIFMIVLTARQKRADRRAGRGNMLKGGRRRKACRRLKVTDELPAV